MNRIDTDVALELASHEGLVRQAYRDSEGVWTWSIGVTSASGHDVTRYIGRPQALEHCLAVYVWLLERRYAPAVRDAFRGRVLTQAQFAAALSFHYNTGAIARAGWVRLWRAGDTAGARRAFMDWSRPAAILPRRRQECALFFDAAWSFDGGVTEFTRLTAGATPERSSARRIDIRAAMAVALGAGTGTPVHPPSQAPPSPSATLHPAAAPPRPATAPAAAFAGDLFPIR
ncbi:GH24 family phage-related lysozyme (muramidase) [Ancylobacter sp. 3268]|uniref:lysozyme n=1 Tax=Ancylobacter sp. 3268 TaxID=2817752 RepID=UPI002855A504|nr:lysozyme [Ancylobacter sp. 3268]MDR6954205.1 GH24 family phage-related lysozyme (muramidase) [Ancylobacter sp. 3268]